MKCRFIKKKLFVISELLQTSFIHVINISPRRFSYILETDKLHTD